jgi:hypothetical protein
LNLSAKFLVIARHEERQCGQSADKAVPEAVFRQALAETVSTKALIKPWRLLRGLDRVWIRFVAVLPLKISNK